ncbi:hypothetical protein QKT49_gp386 [Acanthamoeba castellanii medusavirus]|uniref:Uncharacterized protein n=1 Tax=Acanthamoeba castellanii medusavirus J1 TaxID=3114988 RepID=A0A3T1CX18_9VIRU|nr:hypothetical protein QKT49_gp386 [Acanthamoeba castellanii medusavirus]BBI30377.1 hypothetical protein [Acanthamoeba castellanii medusavirus J1]
MQQDALGFGDNEVRAVKEATGCNEITVRDMLTDSNGDVDVAIARCWRIVAYTTMESRVGPQGSVDLDGKFHHWITAPSFWRAPAIKRHNHFSVDELDVACKQKPAPDPFSRERERARMRRRLERGQRKVD